MKGREAGTNMQGYVRIRVGPNKLLAHRLAWLIHHGEWPAADIDHIDGNRANNALANLRLAKRHENQWNMGRNARNKTGHKGVQYRPRDRVWVARIWRMGVRYYLGTFHNPEDAAAAYAAAAAAMHGDFARTA